MKDELKMVDMTVEKINRATRIMSSLCKPLDAEGHLEWLSNSPYDEQQSHIINDALVYSQTTIFGLLGRISRIEAIAARLATHIANSGPVPEGLVKDVIEVI